MEIVCSLVHMHIARTHTQMLSPPFSLVIAMILCGEREREREGGRCCFHCMSHSLLLYIKCWQEFKDIIIIKNMFRIEAQAIGMFRI